MTYSDVSPPTLLLPQQQLFKSHTANLLKGRGFSKAHREGLDGTLSTPSVAGDTITSCVGAMERAGGCGGRSLTAMVCKVTCRVLG